jgi:hypothetical protein
MQQVLSRKYHKLHPCWLFLNHFVFQAFVSYKAIDPDKNVRKLMITSETGGKFELVL